MAFLALQAPKISQAPNGPYKGLSNGRLVFIIGDFNIDLLSYEKDTSTNEFINMMFSRNLQPSVLYPTRITDTSATLIDNICVSNASDSNNQSGNILSPISDHLPQFCITNDCEFDYKASSHLSYDYSHFDANKFLADYAEMDKSFLTDQNANRNTKFNEFLPTLHCLIDKHCPQKKLNKNRLKLRNKPPWISSHIQKNDENKLFQRFKYTNSAVDFRAYKQFQNRLVNELKESKKPTTIIIFMTIRAT